tara:strand:+ start:11494 stop:12030 length:537 start_codon:yes stop_codon:yes gene_type:complete
MALLNLRQAQTTPLTAAQLDQNFTNLNNEVQALVGGQIDVAAAAASAAAALVSENNAAASEVATAADEVLTDADATATAADAVSTAADAVSTAADVVTAAASEAAAAISAATIPTPTASGFGQLIAQNDADNGYEFIAQGTSGQVLTSNGADALPSMQAAGGGGVGIGTVIALVLALS